MITVRIGGVPEHFNYPWYIALNNQLFRKKGIELRWIDCPGGTGEMVQALEQNTIDLAVVLTEGIVKAISDGNPSRIIQTFIKSPLIWGVHVSTKSRFRRLSDLKSKQAAISRIGSGSHLMAYVNARQMGWNAEEDLKFKIIQNLEGGIQALKNNEADYFLWEKFTTKPYVDQGVFRRIGDCPTPWPCFVIAAHNIFLKQKPDITKIILTIINDVTIGFKSITHIDTILSERYQLKKKDVQEWIGLTEWSQDLLDKTTLEVVQNQLLELDLISEKKDYSSLVQPL